MKITHRKRLICSFCFLKPLNDLRLIFSFTVSQGLCLQARPDHEIPKIITTFIKNITQIDTKAQTCHKYARS